MVWRRGLCPHALLKRWVASNIGWSVNLRYRSQRLLWIAHCIIPHWIRRWQSQAYRRWRNTPPATRTQSHNLFQQGPLWTYVWRRRVACGQGCKSSVGRRIDWTCRGYRLRIGRRNWNMRRRRKRTRGEILMNKAEV